MEIGWRMNGRSPTNTLFNLPWAWGLPVAMPQTYILCTWLIKLNHLRTDQQVIKQLLIIDRAADVIEETKKKQKISAQVSKTTPTNKILK